LSGLSTYSEGKNNFHNSLLLDIKLLKNLKKDVGQKVINLTQVAMGQELGAFLIKLSTDLSTDSVDNNLVF